MDWFTKDSTTKTRTDGDGMESAESEESTSQQVKATKSNQITKQNSDAAIKYEPRYPQYLKLGELVNLTPKEIIYCTKKPKAMSKDPKFVPYEPYKAATRPILPVDKSAMQIKKKSSKNNMDLNVLVSQMAMIDTNPIPFKSCKKTVRKTSEVSMSTDIVSDLTKKQYETELSHMKAEVNSLRRENDNLKDQIKQQAQVNKELKTMLVASMGEDLETTVQTLTEDKQQLASALINSAKHLSTHQEQTEWLAGQCEVWRSKFLASSLMVEELAGWKVSFTQRTEDLQSALRQMLEERNRVRDILVHSYRNLQSLHENWLANLASKEMHYMSINEMGGYGTTEQMPIGKINLVSSRPKSSNIIDLASVNLKFSENLCNGVEKVDDFSAVLNELEINTDSENFAEKLLGSPLVVSGKNDHPSSALVYHAYTKTGMIPNIACCSHCNGQVQLL